MPSSAKHSVYKRSSLIGPAVAYGCYIVLLIAALLKQRTGVGKINFMFLTLWGIVVLFILLLLCLLGFVRRKELKLAAVTVNIAVSIVVIVLSLSIIHIVYESQTANYACDDFVRCVVTN